MFRKSSRLLCSTVLMSFCLPGTVLAVNETFSYPDGLLEGQGAVGDWAGAWTIGTQSAPPTGSTPWQVQSNSLAVSPINPAAAFGYEDSDVQRDLATPMSGSSVYMSYIITPGDMGASYDPNLFTDGSTAIVAGFADTDGNVDNDGPMITTYRFHEGFTGLVTDGFAISLGGVFSSSNTNIGTWTQGQTYRLVGRLTFNAQGQKEQWSVWIDPLAESDPADGSVTNDIGYTSIGTTRLYEYVDNFTAVSSSLIDDLRIGDTWASVTDPIPEPIPGDLNGDGFVGLVDLDIVLDSWNQTIPPGNPLADPTGDNFVGLADLDIVLNNWNAGIPPGQATNVPEPGTLLLFSIILLAVDSRTSREAAV